MTQVTFHLGASDKALYLCRLLRKAYRQDARVRVLADQGELARLDAALWTFDPLEFIPHARLESTVPPIGAMAKTRIWLTHLHQAWPQDMERADTLVNMTNEIAPQAAEFERVIEVVSEDPSDKAAARHRWRHYKALGMDCLLHEV